MSGQISIFDNYLPLEACNLLNRLIFGIDDLTQATGSIGGSLPLTVKMDGTSPGLLSLTTGIYFNKQDTISHPEHSPRKRIHDIALKFFFTNPLLSNYRPMVGRVFLQLPNNLDVSHKMPHVNVDKPHLVVLYYINGGDGTTAFYNNNEIFKEVEPKRNRLVIFDGSIKHAVGIPKKMPRAVLTYDAFPTN